MILAVNEREQIFNDELQALGYIESRGLLPVYGERLSFFIAGPPGCGKSVTTAQILSLFPNDIKYLFTDIREKDRAFKNIDFRKVKMTKEILSTLTLDDLTRDGDCWCVFDDIDKIRDPALNKLLIALMDNIIANGRSHGGHNINIIVTSHSLADYKKTKYSIENCNYWVIFPNKTIKSQLVTLLKKIGLEKEDFSLFNRVIIHRSTPLFIITDFFISII